MRGARHDAGQSSVNKLEGRADCMAQEQSSVGGRAELKAKVISFLHSVVLPVFYSARKRVFLVGRSNRKSVGAASQWRGGAASQNGTQSVCKNIPWVRGPLAIRFTKDGEYPHVRTCNSKHI